VPAEPFETDTRPEPGSCGVENPQTGLFASWPAHVSGDIRRVHIGLTHGFGPNLRLPSAKLLHISKILFATAAKQTINISTNDFDATKVLRRGARHPAAA
jgi:hypothetical protein